MIEIESGFTGTAYPLTNPRIAAFPVTGTVTASTAAAGFDGNNANNELTWTFWKPTAVPANWELAFTSTAISYIGIASHDCGTVGATVLAQRWNGSSWVTMATHVPTDNSPILFLLTQRTLDKVRVRITGAIPTIGVIWAGDVLELPQKCVWTGSLPFNEAIQSAYADTVSDGGHVLGRYETRKAIPCAMTVNNLSETWAAANIPALQTHLRTLPIFMADRPSEYPKSIVFGSVTEPLRVERAAPVLAAARSLTLNVTGNTPA
jgi:hypothetical protein